MGSIRRRQNGCTCRLCFANRSANDQRCPATATNPPLAIPLTFTGTIRLDNAINLAGAAGLAPQSINHGFDNAYMQSWNLNVQREVTRSLAVMAGYFGSRVRT